MTGNNWEDLSAAAELYDPDSGIWTATAGMIEIHGGHTATLLLDGSLLVAGGGQTITAEIYDVGRRHG